jgi:hypothetical protein
MAEKTLEIKKNDKIMTNDFFIFPLIMQNRYYLEFMFS